MTSVLEIKLLEPSWGRDCRNNLYLLPTGETVYFIASVVVLYNVEEQLQRHYTGHNDDVKCLAVHPDRITIATGQVAGTSKDGKWINCVFQFLALKLNQNLRARENVIAIRTIPLHLQVEKSGEAEGLSEDAQLLRDKSSLEPTSPIYGQLPPNVRIWDSVTLNTLHVIGIGFFDRAVTCIAFSKSNGGSNLCAVDDSNDHVLSVWDWQKEERLADVKKQEKPKFVLCVTFSENGDTITGDSSGNILVWGKGTNRISYAVQGAHEGGIFALCMLRDGTLVSGGGKDRKLISWDGNYQKLHKTEALGSYEQTDIKVGINPKNLMTFEIFSMQIPEQFGPIRTVAEGKGDVILIGTTRNFVLQGTLSGDFTPITQDPAQSSGFHPSGSVVAVGTLTGRWFVFDTETKDLVTVHTDGNEQLSVMRYSPDGNFLAIGSHDNCIYIYGVSDNGRKYARVGKCSGHSSFITHLDWSVNSQFLMSNSGDYEILY
ncbi:hypothetical protein EI555_017319 [Monodon monoceros]|uniref:HELP domain-containing protein n=1 Tax=Monodon monoceros TaxID=40151 RepID=A0A4U1FLD9_MONMO|nr:hypothetical protein EI555_017319 [Monodon monoceros]